MPSAVKRTLVRGTVLGAALAWGAPVFVALVASCSSTSGSGTAAADAATDDASAADGTAQGNDAATTGNADATVEGASDTGPACPLRSDLRAACDGSDPRVVFFPPLACDPRNLDAGPSGDAGAERADGGANVCAPVSPTDVSFTSAACAAFVDAETAGTISYETSGLAPSFTEPSDGDALTADEWSVFVWSKGKQALRPSIARFFEPEAHALMPLAGDAYVIVFSQGCTEILRAMVASTFWAPDPASWTTLATLKGPVTVRVYWAKFAADGIKAGPVASAPITITMQQ